MLTRECIWATPPPQWIVSKHLFLINYQKVFKIIQILFENAQKIIKNKLFNIQI